MEAGPSGTAGRRRRDSEGAAAGAEDRRFSTTASFFDYDGDGWLDLFVGNYHRFLVASHTPCFMPSGATDYCGPLARPPPRRPGW